jgi:hypothetical protein
VQLLASPQQVAVMKRRRGVMMNTFFTLLYHKSLFSLFYWWRPHENPPRKDACEIWLFFTFAYVKRFADTRVLFIIYINFRG